MSKTTGTKSHYRPADADQPAYPGSLIRGIWIPEERPVITDSGCADDKSEHIVLSCPGSGIFVFCFFVVVFFFLLLFFFMTLVVVSMIYTFLPLFKNYNLIF